MYRNSLGKTKNDIINQGFNFLQQHLTLKTYKNGDFLGVLYSHDQSQSMARNHTDSRGSHSNLKNAIVAFLAPLPSILCYLSFLNHSYYDDHHDNINSLSPLWKWCYNRPLLLAHTFFFLNVNVLFWAIAHMQSSHWMIDLYWTVIPVLLVHYFASHPLAQELEYDIWRSRILILLTWVWSIRLTHSYFRRENWQWGAREDWRFTDMGKQYSKHWWWMSFFAVYVSQQVISGF